jgi:hypothetical protein
LEKLLFRGQKKERLDCKNHERSMQKRLQFQITKFQEEGRTDKGRNGAANGKAGGMALQRHFIVFEGAVLAPGTQYGPAQHY